MRLLIGLSVVALLAGGGTASAQQAQQAPAAGAPAAEAEPQPFQAGQPLGVTVEENFTPISDNVKVYGAIVNAESCMHDETRNLILAINRGADQNQAPNDGFVSLINPDGSVHTARWIGVNRNGLVLNQPFGSDIHNGTLYLADRDGGTEEGEPSISVIRMFNMETGEPTGEVPVPDSTGFNDIEVAEDGTIYASQTGGGNANLPQRIYKVTPDGTASVFLEGAPLARPNGVAIDNDGNIVVVNIEDDAVLTFSPEGELVSTEKAAQAGSDGIVIMPDGTKYVSSVRMGGISRIRPGEEPELIATGIPSAASMCYDSTQNQLVVPMNPNNALAFVALE